MNRCSTQGRCSGSFLDALWVLDPMRAGREARSLLRRVTEAMRRCGAASHLGRHEQSAQGRMNRHQATIKISLAILVLFALAPAAGDAAPLLSGYGGPGSGSQAILGSTLIGGSTGGGGGAATSSSSTEAGSEVARSSAGSSSSPRHARTHSGTHASSQRSGSSHGAATTPHEAVAAQTQRVAAADASAGGWQIVGLSGIDLFYVAMIVVFLAVAGFFTGRLAHRPE